MDDLVNAEILYLQSWSEAKISNIYMKVKVAQLGPTPSDPVDCSPPGSSVHGIFQARVLEWVAIAFSASLGYRDTKNNAHILI